MKIPSIDFQWFLMIHYWMLPSTTTDFSIPGVAGSIRYMAPEVALGKGAVFASDIFSFGIVLWELLTLELPHKKIQGTQKFWQKVATQGQRTTPNCKTIQAAHLKDLQKNCREKDPQAQPSFATVPKVWNQRQVGIEKS